MTLVYKVKDFYQRYVTPSIPPSLFVVDLVHKSNILIAPAKRISRSNSLDRNSYVTPVIENYRRPSEYPDSRPSSSLR